MRCSLFLTALVGMLSCASAMKASVRLHAAPEQQADHSCDCLAWADAYSKFGASCSALGDYMCGTIFMKLPNEQFCMNDAPGAMPQQWCYVSEECATGQEPTWGGTARWRNCGDETKLGDKKVMELVEWTRAQDIDFGMIAQWAYETWPDHTLEMVTGDLFGVAPPFADAPPFRYYVQEKDRLNVLDFIPLNEKLAENSTVFWNSCTGQQPYGVSDGRKLYWINFGPDFEASLARGEDFFARPGRMNTVACVVGCETNYPTWWSMQNNPTCNTQPEIPESVWNNPGVNAGNPAYSVGA